MAAVSGTLRTGPPLAPPAYSVAVLVPLLATQSGLVGDSARPQALTTSGSVSAARPGTLETRSASVNLVTGESAAAGVASAGASIGTASRAVPSRRAARGAAERSGQPHTPPLIGVGAE